MSHKWTEATLGDIVEFQRGFDLPVGDRRDGIVPVIASTGPVGVHDESKVKGPGVVIGRSGSIGGGQYIRDDFWPLNTTLWVKNFRGNVPRFIYYFITNLRLDNFNVGSGVPTLNRNHIHPIPIRYPTDIGEQQAIAGVLGTLDDKIELNQRMNRTLDEMARELFKSWFVDFGPVNANSAGNPTLPPDLAALFPAEFEPSPIGRKPVGWEIMGVQDLCQSITSGGTPARRNKAYWSDGSIPWFKTGELHDGPLLRASEHITDEGLAKSACKLWPAGTILFALYASPTVGRLGVLMEEGTSNQAAAGLIVKNEYGVGFLAHLLIEARVKLQQIAVGAAQQNINQKILKEHQVIVPPEETALAFSDIAGSLWSKREQLARESHQLGQLRDALLPKLLSGELSVADAVAEVPT